MTQRFPGALAENDPNELQFLQSQLLPSNFQRPSPHSSGLSGLNLAECLGQAKIDIPALELGLLKEE